MPRSTDHDPPQTPHPVTRSEFARRTGRKPSSVTEACQGPLLAACMPGGRINAVHPAAVAWAAKRGIDPSALLDPVARAAVEQPPIEAPGAIDVSATMARTSMRGRGRPKAGKAPATASDTDYSQPQDVTDLLQLSLHDLTSRHGSAQGFSDWLDTRKQIAETARLESRNDRDAGRLISAELVKHHVFDLLDGQNRRLLTNTPSTISVRALSAARNGSTLEDLRALIASAIGAELRVSRDRVRRAIRACKAGDNPPEVTPAAETQHASEIHQFARDLTARLQADAVPTVIDLLLKLVVHAASGDRWNPELAKEVMATKVELAPEAMRVIGNILAAHVTNAVTDAITQEHST